ncbi:hypothetical protein B0H12DRAFT_1239884 [Mycena haematopus]|nr:hypothetical protein B0H12DRAFT_1239884 [Mycena haematopus]
MAQIAPLPGGAPNESPSPSKCLGQFARFGVLFAIVFFAVDITTAYMGQAS